MDERFEAEVIETHEFLTGWLSGGLPKDAATYMPFAEVLADDFMMISPSGEATLRADLVPGLEQAHGAEGGEFRIWIGTVVCAGRMTTRASAPTRNGRKAAAQRVRA